MQNIVRRMVAYAVPLLVLFSAGPVLAQMQMTKSDTTCPRYAIAANLKAVVAANKGVVEPVHTPDGIAVVATAPTDAGVKAIQAAAAKYQADMSKAPVAGGGPNCVAVMRAVSGGQVKESVMTTSNGALILISTGDQNLRDVIQKGNCCDYCVCPSTNHRCSGCC